ncbi:DUF664 domain-containing protein [Actinoallomurus sp. CA-142502]|uniref:mycothiol transferase n=1 Tax=Actinoallomurus sp. CA-142502 TaxID=3239885 RepID=UPI003D8A7035
MTDVPEADYAPARSADTRAAPPATAGETLTAFLDRHRRTFALKCAGVPAARLSDKGVPPSGLSPHGLLRHLTAVERWWFAIQFADEDLPVSAPGTTATPTSCASGSTAPRDTGMTTITAAGAVPTGTGPADAASAAPARH